MNLLRDRTLQIRGPHQRLVTSADITEALILILERLGCGVVEQRDDGVYFESGTIYFGPPRPVGGITSGTILVAMESNSVRLRFKMRFGQVLPLLAFVGPTGLFLALTIGGIHSLLPFGAFVGGLLLQIGIMISFSCWNFPRHICWRLEQERLGERR